MQNIRLLLEYDGTRYLGWQRQPKGPSIQETVEAALLKITGEEAVLIGSGRTDAGVHALGQMANFKTHASLGPDEFQRALNSVLPGDIAVLAAAVVPGGFHSQYDAQTKTYLYRILAREHRSAIERDRVWLVQDGLDLNTMATAAALFEGTHDFRAFALEPDSVKSTVRHVLRATITGTGEMIELEIEATGFLKRMVRLITGTIVNAGKGRLTLADISGMLETGQRSPLAPAAPPQGLYLKEVMYKDPEQA